MRLIDADALRKRTKAKNASNAMMKAMREECVAEIDNAPTIEPEHIADDERKIADLHKMVNYLLSRLEQQWIPCSESLPAAQTEVNVSCLDDSGDTKFWYTASGWVTTNGEYWIVDNEINPFVIAWMPLPEPWREGEE